MLPGAGAGIVGTYNSPDTQTVTVALGASLFDERYGLADKLPRHLTPMPAFALDELAAARATCSPSATVRRTPASPTPH